MTTPKEFDWVTERFRCNIAMFFQELRDLADRSVKTRNKLSKLPCFQLVRIDPEAFAVNRAGSESVLFKQTEMRIRVTGYSQYDEQEYLTRLGKYGKCELADSKGERVELWEVLSRSLDALFFDSETDHPRA